MTRTKHKQPHVLCVTRADTMCGLGHLMRCIALAQAMERALPIRRSHGVRHRAWYWYLAGSECALAERIIHQEAPWSHIWHGGTFDMTRLQSDRIDTLIADLPEESEHAASHACGLAQQVGALRIVFMDDYLLPGNWQVVVNGNAYWEEVGKRDSVAALWGDHAFCGLDYLCLRPTFAQQRPTIEGRLASQKEPPRHILITLGGATPQAERDVVEATVRHALPDAQVFADSPSETISAASVAGRYTWADLAVARGGSTLYELACMGVPTISLPREGAETLNAIALHKAGTCDTVLAYGEDGSRLDLRLSDQRLLDRLSDHVRVLSEDHARRQLMVSRGMALVDGEGAQRVAQGILERKRA